MRWSRWASDERRRRFDPRRADIIVAGAVILEALAQHLSLKAVVATDRGLRHGVLVDLQRRALAGDSDQSMGGAARVLGRRFYFDERHASQVARIALQLFDGLAEMHKLPASVRPFLEAAALLHDLGNAVSYQKHHRHTQYLIQNADIPGLADRERDLVARIARFHRRSPPDLDHAGMAGLTPAEARTVRKLATMLRVADALDRSHHQPITDGEAPAQQRGDQPAHQGPGAGGSRAVGRGPRGTAVSPGVRALAQLGSLPRLMRSRAPTPTPARWWRCWR